MKNLLRKALEESKANRKIYNDNRRKLFTINTIKVINIIFITLLPLINNNGHFEFNITLKVKGPGNAQILDVNFFNANKPDRIFINGTEINVNERNYIYNFIQTDNIVQLLWNQNNIVPLLGMFSYCTNITEIDLSNFNTSKLTDMTKMFYNCLSLTSLDLSNFDTSNVIDMNNMFYNCSSLTSLDLSNFDTSKVIEMYRMFYNCLLLTSLDLSNFITSNVENMDNMFSGCSKLEYINLKKF